MKIAVPVVLVLLVISGFLIRFHEVGSIPYGLNRDEAALAYNGYLLKETGKDEWQRVWPLNLESFGDYKLLGYPAILSVFFRFLAIDDTTVRLPAVLAGSVLPLALYLLARRLKLSVVTSSLLAALVVITPVFFFYSRIAYEAMVALTLFTFGTALLFKEKYSLPYLAGTVIVFALSILTYNTPLLLLPFVVAMIPFIQGLSKIKQWWLPVLLLSLIWVAAYISLSQTLAQKSGITIFSDITVRLEDYPNYRDQFTGVNKTLLGNHAVFYSKTIVTNVIKTISPQFLVQRGGAHPWHSLLGWAHLNWSELVLMYLGVALLIFSIGKKVLRKATASSIRQTLFDSSWLKYAGTRHSLLLYLFAISAVPAAITTDAPHATRSLFFFLMALLVGGEGIELAVSFATKQLRGRVLLVIALIVFGFSIVHFSIYTREYFSSYKELSTRLFQSKFIDAVEEAEAEYPNQTIDVIDQGGYQYILLSWYKKISPQEFFSTSVRQLPNSIGFRYGERVSHFHFIDKPEDRLTGEKAYIIWDDEQFQWLVKDQL